MPLESLRPDAKPKIKDISEESPENGELIFDIEKELGPEMKEELVYWIEERAETPKTMDSALRLLAWGVNIFPELKKDNILKRDKWRTHEQMMRRVAKRGQLPYVEKLFNLKISFPDKIVNWRGDDDLYESWIKDERNNNTPEDKCMKTKILFPEHLDEILNQNEVEELIRLEFEIYPMAKNWSKFVNSLGALKIAVNDLDIQINIPRNDRNKILEDLKTRKEEILENTEKWKKLAPNLKEEFFHKILDFYEMAFFMKVLSSKNIQLTNKGLQFTGAMRAKTEEKIQDLPKKIEY